jgi:ribosome biogenesis GTPase
MKSRFRVIFEGRGNFRVMNHENKVFKAEITGKLRVQTGGAPAIGDWVTGSLQPGGWISIEEVHERTGILSRRDPSGAGTQILATNVDILLIITSANQDLNLNRLDRYVTLAHSGGLRPVIVINKMDLVVDDPHSLMDLVAARFSTVDIHGISLQENWNLNSLDAYLGPGQTVALVGSSGVGKSSLTNFLLGDAAMTTQPIRASDSRGRHTTTHRELHVTETGAMVIDTPGIRQVGLTDDADLGESFADIESLSSLCKFTDCKHDTEPKCAIRNALDGGSLNEERWRSYLKLQRELAFERRKGSKALQSQEKDRWAKISVSHRQRQRLTGR